MYSIQAIQKGIAAYIDNEVMGKFPTGTWQKVAISSIVAVAIRKYVGKIADNEFLKSMGLVENGEADIEAYANELKRSMPPQGVTIDVPMLGQIVLTSPDIDHIIEYIKGAMY